MSVTMNTNEAYYKGALFEHQFWLQIMGDHARFIFDSLASSEGEEVQKAHYFIRMFDQMLKEKSADYAVHFEQFYLKAVELAGYMRTNLKEFPALARFNKEVEVTMFTEFLCELEEMEIDAEVLGAWLPCCWTIWRGRVLLFNETVGGFDCGEAPLRSDEASGGRVGVQQRGER